MKFYDMLSLSAQRWIEAEELDAFNSQLKTAFLANFSETPDNVQTAGVLKIGHVDSGNESQNQGLVFGGGDQLISDILWTAFGESRIPASVKEQYPDLSDEAWNQVLRIAQIAVMAFEKSSSTPDK